MGLCIWIGLAAARAQIIDDPSFHAPGRNKIAWVQSPNFGPRKDVLDVDTIVIHHTAADTLGGTVKWFVDPKSQVSAHYVIGRDGSIVQQVSTFARAWHAGVSRDQSGRSNVNDFSIGIELVNVGDGKEPYPEEQIEALHHLIAELKRRFPKISQVTSHKFIAQPPGRKNDPRGFPWDRLSDLGLELVP